MPYNPIEKYPKVLNNIRQQGSIYEATITQLYNSIMITMGVIKEHTIKDHIKAMVTLGIIHEVGFQIFCIANICPHKQKKEGTVNREEQNQRDIDNRLPNQPSV